MVYASDGVGIRGRIGLAGIMELPWALKVGSLGLVRRTRWTPPRRCLGRGRQFKRIGRLAHRVISSSNSTGRTIRRPNRIAAVAKWRVL